MRRTGRKQPTPLTPRTLTATEISRLTDGEPSCTTALAALQFDDHDRCDDVLEREILPAPGDRLALVRRLDDGTDRNAVEVWWHDGHRRGHVPCEEAAVLAARLDAGLPYRAFMWNAGAGQAWTLRAMQAERPYDR